MKRYDVVVVGAGPAGSACAYRLASADLSVLLVDKARFPRDKPCGGGVTLRALRQLPFAIDPVVEDVVETVELRLGYEASFARSSGTQLCLMTQRRRLDHFLAAKAAEAGVEFRDGVRVDFNGAVHVSGERVDADFVIGADGVNGVTARAVGRDYGMGVALEGNLSHTHIDATRYAGRMVIELGVVPGGYGWVFPKGDHVNVGVGGWADEGPRLRDRLARLCEAHGANPDELSEVRGYRLPYRRATSPLAGNRLLLVGDAAGLVDPLSGDGMYEAFVSARIAAAAVLDGDLAAYPRNVTAELGALHTTSWAAKRALDRFPRITFALLRLPVTWPVLAKTLRGDLGDPTAASGLGRLPLRALNALGRAA